MLSQAWPALRQRGCSWWTLRPHSQLETDLLGEKRLCWATVSLLMATSTFERCRHTFHRTSPPAHAGRKSEPARSAAQGGGQRAARRIGDLRPASGAAAAKRLPASPLKDPLRDPAIDPPELPRALSVALRPPPPPSPLSQTSQRLDLRQAVTVNGLGCQCARLCPFPPHPTPLFRRSFLLRTCSQVHALKNTLTPALGWLLTGRLSRISDGLY